MEFCPPRTYGDADERAAVGFVSARIGWLRLVGAPRLRMDVPPDTVNQGNPRTKK